MKGLCLTAALLVGLLLASTAAAGLLAVLWQRSPTTQAPAELRALAAEAAGRSGSQADLLLAIAYRQTAFGQARSDVPDEAVPADLRAAVDLAALAPDGVTSRALGLSGGRRLGDWVGRASPDAEPGVGFLEIQPAAWRAQASLAPGAPLDPYRPLDSMLVAGSYLARLQAGGLDLRAALTAYGGADLADEVLRLLAGAAASGQPMSCAGYALSQDYGPVAFELEPPLFGFSHFHSGWDLVCPAGTPVDSVGPGVAAVQSDPAGYGISVMIRSGDLYVRYAHLAVAEVAVGEAVFAGRELGREGSTGNSTGAHLHFEVDRGCPLPRCSVNPAVLIANPSEGHGR